MTRPRRTRVAALALAAGLTVAGCGDDDEDSAGDDMAATLPPPATVGGPDSIVGGEDPGSTAEAQPPGSEA
ncbi:MAG: hypothetical protein M3487_01210, partial [Actinomycetota bacterium]|nr:hypothetical protein [Actinomycetota bacterium]